MAIGAALAARLETAVLHRIVPCIAASCLIGVAAQAADPAAPPAAAAPVISPEALAHAAQIRAEVDARYPGLRVTEASSTAVIESLTLFEGADPRVVLANNGIYYAVCPNRARCPFPGRKARLVAALVPRRVALELAVRTFLETSANLVMVSLPTRRFIVLVFERDAIDAYALSVALAGYLVSDRSPQLVSLVDTATLPHLYAPLALAPTPTGLDTLLALPLGLAP
jgi:hypothetical protein